jgi:hypothetical protein
MISRVRVTGTASMPYLFSHKGGKQLTNLSLYF